MKNMSTTELVEENVMSVDQSVAPSLAARFKWLEIDGQHILDIDMQNATEEESIAIAHATHYYGQKAPTTGKKYMMTNMSGAKVSLAAIRVTIRQIRQKKCFHMVCGYGTKSKMLIVGARLIGAYFGNGGMTFNTREQAISYLSTFK